MADADFLEMAGWNFEDAYPSYSAPTTSKPKSQDELLSRPVKLSGNLSTSEIPEKGLKTMGKKKLKPGDQDGSKLGDATTEAATAGTTAQAATTKKSKNKNKAGTEAAQLADRVLPQVDTIQDAAPARTPKKSKNKFKFDADSSAQDGIHSVAAATAPEVEAPTTSKKKNKNKFKVEQFNAASQPGSSATPVTEREGAAPTPAKRASKNKFKTGKEGVSDGISAPAVASTPSDAAPTTSSKKSKRDAETAKNTDQDAAQAAMDRRGSSDVNPSKEKGKEKLQGIGGPSQAAKRAKLSSQETLGAAAPTTTTIQRPPTPSAPRTSALLDKMRAKLQGGQFRHLNEELYTRSGNDALSMMQKEPELFTKYHDGFKQQTLSWPKQPQDMAIAWLAKRPAEMVVADLGCGDARLSASVKQKVHSFDLISSAPGVIACNMANVPLPSSSVDVAIFSLALMGIDYGTFLVEAARLLRHRGWLWIAEVRSRFSSEGKSSDEFAPFVKCVNKLGFQLVKKDVSNTMFVIFEFRKHQVASSPESIVWPELKACVYKRR